MSDVIQDLGVLEAAMARRNSQLARAMALREDTAIMYEKLPMALREELLAEAMTNAKHVYIDSLSKAQQKVADLRLDIGDKWPDPDVMDSYVFLVSEVGEVGDALLRANFGHRGDYVRNNVKEVDVGAELGDAYLMLCTLATCLGIDLDEALQGCIAKLRSKYDTT